MFFVTTEQWVKLQAPTGATIEVPIGSRDWYLRNGYQELSVFHWPVQNTGPQYDVADDAGLSLLEFDQADNEGQVDVTEVLGDISGSADTDPLGLGTDTGDIDLSSALAPSGGNAGLGSFDQLFGSGMPDLGLGDLFGSGDPVGGGDLFGGLDLLGSSGLAGLGSLFGAFGSIFGLGESNGLDFGLNLDNSLGLGLDTVGVEDSQGDGSFLDGWNRETLYDNAPVIGEARQIWGFLKERLF